MSCSTLTAIGETAQADAEELLERAAAARGRAGGERIECEGSTSPLIAEDADGLGGSLPAGAIAATKERRQ